MHFKLIAATFVSLLVLSSALLIIDAQTNGEEYDNTGFVSASDSADSESDSIPEIDITYTEDGKTMTVVLSAMDYDLPKMSWQDHGLILAFAGIPNDSPTPVMGEGTPSQVSLYVSQDEDNVKMAETMGRTTHYIMLTELLPPGHYVFDVTCAKMMDNGYVADYVTDVVIHFDIEIIEHPPLLTGSFKDFTIQTGVEYKLSFTTSEGTTVSYAGPEFFAISEGSVLSGVAGEPGVYDLSMTAQHENVESETVTWKVTVEPEPVPLAITLNAQEVGAGSYLFTIQYSGGAVTWSLGDGTAIPQNSNSVNHTFESGVFDVKVTVVNDIEESASDEYVVVNHDGQPSEVAYSTVEYRYSPDLGEFTDIPVVSMSDLENPFLSWDNATKTVIGTPPVALIGKTYHAILQFGEEKIEWNIQILAASSVMPTASFLCSVEDLSVSFTPVTNVEIGSSLYKWVITDVHSNNIAVSNDRDFSFTAETSGTYYVTLTITNVKGDASSSQTVELVEAAPEKDDNDKETEFDPFDKENWKALLDEGYVILSSADTKKIIIVVVLAIVCILIGAVVAYRPKHGGSHKVRSSGHRRNSR